MVVEEWSDNGRSKLDGRIDWVLPSSTNSSCRTLLFNVELSTSILVNLVNSFFAYGLNLYNE